MKYRVYAFLLLFSNASLLHAADSWFGWLWGNNTAVGVFAQGQFVEEDIDAEYIAIDQSGKEVGAGNSVSERGTPISYDEQTADRLMESTSPKLLSAEDKSPPPDIVPQWVSEAQIQEFRDSCAYFLQIEAVRNALIAHPHHRWPYQDALKKALLVDPAEATRIVTLGLQIFEGTSFNEFIAGLVITHNTREWHQNIIVGELVQLLTIGLQALSEAPSALPKWFPLLEECLSHSQLPHFRKTAHVLLAVLGAIAKEPKNCSVAIEVFEKIQKLDSQDTKLFTLAFRFVVGTSCIPNPERTLRNIMKKKSMHPRANSMEIDWLALAEVYGNTKMSEALKAYEVTL